jgi:predicted secreted protein with PEFG-CTERM motif
VNLSWDPITIEPDKKTKFIFTIRDGSTNQPLRNSEYTFVILQGGQEIHRTTGLAQVGGESEDYYFTENQTGPSIIRFENIRNTGQETEFGILVVPEFGSFTVVILTISIMAIIIASKKNLFLVKNF